MASGKSELNVKWKELHTYNIKFYSLFNAKFEVKVEYNIAWIIVSHIYTHSLYIFFTTYVRCGITYFYQRKRLQ